MFVLFILLIFSLSLFPLKQNALLTALPYLAMWLISLGVSPISDYLINRGCISTRTGRKLFNSIGHWIPAMTLVILPYMTEPKSAIFLLTIAVGLNGSTYVGYMVNHMDLSPNFAGSLMGLTNSLANIMSVLGPLTVGYILTPNHDIDVCFERRRRRRKKIENNCAFKRKFNFLRFESSFKLH